LPSPLLAAHTSAVLPFKPRSMDSFLIRGLVSNWALQRAAWAGNREACRQLLQTNGRTDV
jgi:hypothetical protein